MIVSNTSAILNPDIDLISKWKPSTWEDYLTYRDHLSKTRVKLYFNQNRLLVETGRERIIYSDIKDLLTMILGLWFSQQAEQTFSIFGGCQLEKPETLSVSADLLLYLGENYPRKLQRNKQYINLDNIRVPELLIEIGDANSVINLDEKKHLYAELCIPEYWKIDFNQKQIIAFRLQDDGNYQIINISVALAGLPIELLQQTLHRLNQGKGSKAAIWFSEKMLNIMIGG